MARLVSERSDSNHSTRCSHEPPVVAGPVKIIYDGRLPGNDGKTLVVEKPGSMPVRAKLELRKSTLDTDLSRTLDRFIRRAGTISTRCSRSSSTITTCRWYTVRSPLPSVPLFRFFVGRLDGSFRVCPASNRLDRLTSGVMICSLTVEASKELGAWFGGQREGGVKKEYVARCVGEFPE